jgi:hypothetical protein
MVFVVWLAVLLNSCCTIHATHGYRPQVRPLEDQHLENIPRGKCTVAIINVTESREVRMTSFWLQPPAVYTDLEHWGDDICGTLKNALESRGYIPSDSGEKVIEIRVTQTFAHYREFFSKHRVSLEVELGGRYNLKTEVIKHSGWGWERAAYGSVMDAAYWILHNETVQRYLRAGQEGGGYK